MEREDSLFEACRVLFGNDIELSREFLCYLREKGVTSAFRKRAKEVHPDKALISGFSLQRCQKEFVALQLACDTLRQYIASREIRSHIAASAAEKPNKSLCIPLSCLKRNFFLDDFFIVWVSFSGVSYLWRSPGRDPVGQGLVSWGSVWDILIINPSSRF